MNNYILDEIKSNNLVLREISFKQYISFIFSTGKYIFLPLFLKQSESSLRFKSPILVMYLVLFITTPPIYNNMT